MRHVVLMPFGSAGDVFPFIWLGKLLMARGHRVTMVTTCIFAEAAEAAGIAFVGLGTLEEVEAIGEDRRIWKLGVGTKVVMDYAVEWSERYLEAFGKLGEVDLIMAPLTAFGARMAREKHGIPLVTVHLQPMAFMSAYETPLLHPWLGWFPAMPVWAKRFLFSLPNAVDLLALPGIRKICSRHGIKPPKSLWREWWDSPDGVLALFPEWLAKPQPDWPGNLLQWDFPMEDLGKEMPMQRELEEFLAAGDKPGVTESGVHIGGEADGERTRRRVLRAAPPLPGGWIQGVVTGWAGLFGAIRMLGLRFRRGRRNQHAAARAVPTDAAAAAFALHCQLHPDKPVVFTPGSANVQAERFFETAAEAVKRLGIRAVFVTRMEGRVPPGMEDQILQVDFVPFSKLLEHASAFVHHGGIGTMAQGFRAGVPQLVMAMSHDQPDNAARLERLGVGIALTPGSFTPERVTKELGRLLGEERWKKAAAEVRGKMNGREDTYELIGWLENRRRL